MSSAGSAGAAGSPAFTVRPSFGPVGATITLTGADFTGDTAATVNGVLADDYQMVSSHRVTAVVPVGATTGPVAVTGTAPMTGPVFTVQQPTVGTSSSSARRLTYSHPLQVTGQEAAAGSNAPVAGQDAVLQHRVTGSDTWHNAKGTQVHTTGPRGIVRWKVTPSANGQFRVHFRQNHSYTGVTTTPQRIEVMPRLKLRPVHTVPALSKSTIRGSIHPRLTGRVYLQQFLSGSWQTVRHTKLEAGHYSFTISPSSLGKLRYRVVSRFDGTHAHATSKSLRLQVVHRTLTLDNSGPDVKALQERLRKLHYYVGSVNGDYGWDTLHAVTAFQKVQGLHPDGETGTKVWNALNHPKLIHLRYPSAGTYEVEVDIAKQVLMFAKDGHITQILDTSTAGGYLYTNSEGGTSRAITPTGHFTIQYKLTGTRVSKLGTLYDPSYFTNTGYAIHGEGNGNDGGNVPPYPNSHGCVRITDDAVIHFFSSPYLAVGTSVWVYG